MYLLHFRVQQRVVHLVEKAVYVRIGDPSEPLFMALTHPINCLPHRPALAVAEAAILELLLKYRLDDFKDRGLGDPVPHGRDR